MKWNYSIDGENASVVNKQEQWRKLHSIEKNRKTTETNENTKYWYFQQKQIKILGS